MVVSLPSWFGIALAFSIGACVGSFVNVCIYRLPRRLSIINPPSHCPYCGTRLQWYDLIPLISILLLLGKCRYCKHPISYRYFMVELLTALAFTASYWQYGFSFHALIVATTLAALIVAFFVDWQWYIIPDEVVWAVVATGIAGAIGTAIALHNYNAIINAIAGLAVGAIALYGIGQFGRLLFKQESMGLGDVKLTAGVGLHLGLSVALIAYFLIAIITGAIIGLIIVSLRKGERHHYIPFGPFLSISAAICLLFPEGVTTLIQRIYGFEPLYVCLMRWLVG